MLRRTFFSFCERLMSTVLMAVPTNDMITMAQLSSSLPDDIMESIADNHGGLASFVRNYPHVFQVKSVEAGMGRNVLTVSRAEYSGTELTVVKPVTPSSQRQFADPSTLPVDLLALLQDKLKGITVPMGVSALYGALKGNDRKELRKYGGILPVLRFHESSVFSLSPLGMLVALKAEFPTVTDDTSLNEDGDDDEDGNATVTTPTPNITAAPKVKGQPQIPHPPKVKKTPTPPMESQSIDPATIHYNAMFLVKYMPLHWTITPEIVNLIPAEVRKKYCVVPWTSMLPFLSDFMERKHGAGCKHAIQRLRRGVNIPDIGVIRTDAEMESLTLSQQVYAFAVNTMWSEPVTWKTLMLATKDVVAKMGTPEKYQASIKRYLARCVKFPDDNRIATFPQQLVVDSPHQYMNRTPLLFQVVKGTVPKHYVVFSALYSRLSPSAKKEAEKHGGLLAWLRSKKEIFEVTVPYLRPVGAKPPHPVAENGITEKEAKLAIRRRYTSYIVTTEDRVLDEIRQRLPKDGSRWTLNRLLGELPAEVLDAIDSDPIPYLLQTCYPCVYIDRYVNPHKNKKETFYLRRGLARDDGTAGEPDYYDPTTT
eukprot:PhF_6_TR701/c0_g1_i1/m.1147